MTSIKSSARLSLTVGIIGATILWMATDLNVMPDPVQAGLDGRVELAKSIAINATTAVEKNRIYDFQTVIQQLVGANDDLLSIGLQRVNGSYSIETSGHQQNWIKDDVPKTCRVSVAIQQGKREWGRVQMLFDPQNKVVAGSIWHYPLPGVVFLFCSLSIGTWMILGQTFKYLNPSKVVPNRVRSALDTLTEGLVLIDPNGEIVHTNKAFDKMIGKKSEDLIGTRISLHEWKFADNDSGVMPWDECLDKHRPIRGKILESSSQRASRKYIVNASPVFGGETSIRGALISFDDVTALEAKKSELSNIIHTLRVSRDEVARQNEELNFLANCDPLTQCFNRRSFWSQYTELWNRCETGWLNLIMVDIDRFKSINDNYGHSTGDEVLKDCGVLLRNVIGERGFVCRYGGEEFIALLPDLDIDDATTIANSICNEFHKQKMGGIDVTCSVGVSNSELGAMDMQHLLDQADQCLYMAKKNGRDQVVRFDKSELLSKTDSVDLPDFLTGDEEPINYSTVTGLLSALTFKCQRTAEHSVRVADLCVAIGQIMLPKRDLYRLEVCGLLHDIGKIGVPDRILNKPGPLTDEEWRVMRQHEEYGVAIVRSAFESDRMADIIQRHQERMSSCVSDINGLFSENQVPLESRIISVCDAFDSMVADQVYRKAQTLDAAIAEMRRCTPDQFDPDVVGHLIQYVSQPGYMESRQVSIETSPQSAVAISRHLENLHVAVATEDLPALHAVVQSLKDDAANGGVNVITDAAHRLEQALTMDDSQVSQVMKIAEEVMQLCRVTRNSIVTHNEPLNH